jgi:hypothetical protein
MKTKLATITVLLAGLFLATFAQAQGPSALVGAWELTEGTAPDGSTGEATGMLVFSGGHYSWIQTFGGDRPSYSSQDEATDAQKLVAFESFGANAGSYTVSGSTLTRDPAAAKNPYVYAPDSTIVATFAIEGRTLTITGENGAVTKYSRLD